MTKNYCELTKVTTSDDYEQYEAWGRGEYNYKGWADVYFTLNQLAEIVGSSYDVREIAPNTQENDRDFPIVELSSCNGKRDVEYITLESSPLFVIIDGELTCLTVYSLDDVLEVMYLEDVSHE